MKKNKLYSILLMLLASWSWAQVTSTETFETETLNSTTFTDNGQVFNITSQAQGPFDVFNYTSGGWNGTGADHQFIDNSNFAAVGMTVGFTISSAGAVPFKLNSMYMFFSNKTLNQAVPGSLTLVGKLGGVTKYTATASTGFVTSLATNNGFTFINLATFGGSNNANTAIDQIVITTGGQFEYVAMDAFTWTSIPPFTASILGTNVGCNGGSTGSATVTATGGTSPYTYAWSGGGTAAVKSSLTAGIYTATVTDNSGSITTATINITQPTALFTTTAVTNVACNGGSNGVAAISGSGGAGGYSYLWSNGASTSVITALLAGVYTATVTDANGCKANKSAQVTQPTALVTTTAVTNVACNGGSNGVASITASGGAGGYSYLWSNGGATSAITGLLAGIYTATVTDANSCTSIKSALVTQPPALVTATAVTNVACNGGSNGVASITPSGGAGSYTYLWSNGASTSAITGLLAGVYTATVTDANSCTSIKSAQVTQPTALVTTTAVTNVACNGGSNGVASITASGGAGGYSYLWSNGGSTSAITGLLAGIYTATVTDANSCTSIKSALVTQPPALVTTTAVTNVACNGGSNGVASITPSGGAGGYSYLWSNGGSTSAITGLLAGVYTATVTDANSCTSIKSAQVTQPTALVTTTAVTNVACNGGSNGVASITPSGGAGGYSYLWSNGGSTSAITGLLAGVYTATVTDANSCTSIKSAQVTQPTALVTTTAVTNVACNGGSNGVASITPSGGAGGYSYLWSNGASTSAITGLLAGVYTATVTDANSCTSIKSAQVTQPTALVTATAVTNVACNGGSNGVASITPSGGAGSYSYLWSNGGSTSAITGLLAGVYTATVTDANSCTSIKSAQVTQPTALVTTTAVTNVACNGNSTGSATITPSGGTGGYSYLWSNGASTSAITGLLAGVYTATVTDANSCTSIKSAQVTQPTALATTTAVTNVACNGGTGSATVTVSGGTGAYTYSWVPSGGTAASASGLAPGSYTCMVTDANNCTKNQVVTITQPLALTSTGTATNVSCFGGANGIASVTANGGTTPYTYAWAPSGGTNAIASGLAPGTYTCTITDNKMCTKIQTVTITQPATALTSSGTGTNVSCFGNNNGAASVTASGGTAPYTYVWSPSGGTAATATALTANTYTCLITDNNGCTKTQTVSVTQPASGITSSATTTNVSCFGGNNGSVIITVTGGTAPYTYSWTPVAAASATLSGLSQGTYTCLITDNNGCTKTQTAAITQPLALASSVTATNVSCNGGSNGSLTVSVSGGTTPYTYSWTPAGGTSASVSGLPAGTYTCLVTDNHSCTITQTATITEPAMLVANSVVTPAACNGGALTVTVTATGGTAAYTGTGSFSVTPGTYTYTVTDSKGCSATTMINVTQPTPIIASVTSSSVLCNGGMTTVTVSATGGTPAYTGVGTFTAIAGAHTYTVTDNNGCESTASVTIAEPTAIALSISSNTISCNGGAATVTITASGGTPAYIGTGTVSAVAGTHTYTVTDDNGCVATTSITITEPAAITTTLTSSAILCHGDVSTVTVAASGGTPAYTGVGTFTANAGTQTYTVTDDTGCSVTASITITEPAAISSTKNYTLCFGQSLTVGANTYTATGVYTSTFTAQNGCDSTAITNLTIRNAIVVTTTVTGNVISATAQPGATYQWINCDNGNQPIAGATAQSYTISASGKYAVLITVGTCTNTSACTSMTFSPVGIASLTQDLPVSIYPNPNNGQFMIDLPVEGQVTVMDALGRTVLSQVLGHGKHELNLSDAKSGIYFVKIVSNGKQHLEKIIVNQ